MTTAESPAACSASWCLRAASSSLRRAFLVSLAMASPVSDLHQVLLFVGDDLVDLLDAAVNLGLHFFQRLLAVVLVQVSFLDRLLNQLLGVAALVPDGDLVLLALVLDQLDELLAPLLCERRGGLPHL